MILASGEVRNSGSNNMRLIKRKNMFCKCPYCGKLCGYGKTPCKHYQGIKYDIRKQIIGHKFNKE
jgi:predicted nucleic acid-binding Zn finger protein